MEARAAIPANSVAESPKGSVWAFGRNFLLMLLFAILPIDGFPPGIAALHEFGARPVNFVLAIASGIFLLGGTGRWRAIRVRPRRVLGVTVLVLSLSVVNLLVSVFESGPDISTIMSAWGRQFLMLIWGVVSFYTWRRLLAASSPKEYAAIMCVASVVPVGIFLLDYAGLLGGLDAVFELIRTKADSRPSGLSTEPSTFTAWAAVVWPLMLLVGLTASSLARLGAFIMLAALFVTVYLSGARTGIVIFVLQIVYFCYWWLRRQRAFGSRVAVFVFAMILASASVLLVWDRLSSLTNLQETGSNLARLAYTVAGVQLFLSHPILGSGIGQFGYFFPSVVPAFALNNPEVANYTYGVALYRASTFNLFVRLFSEFGFPLGCAIAWWIVRPIVTAARSRIVDTTLALIGLSAVGGAGFWLSQDQYGYQPAILSLAVLSLILAGAPWTQNNDMKKYSGEEANA